MRPEVVEMLVCLKDISKITVKWSKGDITAPVAMEQIAYLLLAVDTPNKPE